MKNLLKPKLTDGHTTHGMLITLGSTELAELLCTLGLDWLWIDLEHSGMSLATAQMLMQTVQFSALTPVGAFYFNFVAVFISFNRQNTRISPQISRHLCFIVETAFSHISVTILGTYSPKNLRIISRYLSYSP